MAAITAQPARPATGIARYVPILQWLPAYQRGWLRFDLIAGLTILALLIPEGMAYAELAGLPPARAVLLDLEMTNEVDMPGAEMLAELKEKLEGQQVDLLLSRARYPVRDLLDRSGVTQKIGAENFHTRTIDGVLAYLGKYHEVIGKETVPLIDGSQAGGKTRPER